MAVRQLYLGGKLRHRGLVARYLAVRERDVVRRCGKVGEDALYMQVFQRGQVVRQAGDVMRQEPCAAHAGVHVDVQVHLLAEKLAQGVEVLCLLHAGEGGAPAVLHNGLPLLGEAGTQDERNGLAAQRVDARRLRRRGHAEEFDILVVQRLGHTIQAVAVRFRFHDSHLAVLRQHAAYHGKVVAHGICVDFRPGAVE